MGIMDINVHCIFIEPTSTPSIGFLLFHNMLAISGIASDRITPNTAR